jgi:hypothetical protein
MLKEGTGKINEYFNKLNNLEGCSEATKAINDWYNKK